MTNTPPRVEDAAAWAIHPTNYPNLNGLLTTHHHLFSVVGLWPDSAGAFALHVKMNPSFQFQNDNLHPGLGTLKPLANSIPTNKVSLCLPGRMRHQG